MKIAIKRVQSQSCLCSAEREQFGALLKRQDYRKPAMRVVTIQQHKMLCGSNPYDGQKSVQTYDDDEDVVVDKGAVW